MHLNLLEFSFDLYALNMCDTYGNSGTSEVISGISVMSRNYVKMTYFILLGPQCEHGTSLGNRAGRVHPQTSKESDFTLIRSE